MHPDNALLCVLFIVAVNFAKVVKPKKIALKEAEDALEIVMKGLRLKQAELQAVEDKLEALDQELKQMEKKKEGLEENPFFSTNNIIDIL